MRFPTLTLALAGIVVMTGCSSLISLNSMATDKEAVIDANLPGVWNAGEGDGAFVIQQVGSKYTVVCSEGSSKKAKFDALLFQVGDARLLDMVTTEEDPLQIPAHLLVRVWPGGSTLRWAFLDSDWLKQAAVKELSSQPARDRTLLTGPTAALHSFVTKYGADERAYDKPETLTRAR